MGGCPSAEEAPSSFVGTSISKREVWASALQHGGCNHKLLHDLLRDERRFVADMHTLVEVFYRPLVRWFEQQQQDTTRAPESSCPISRTDIDSVFSNVNELIVFSRRLLPALEGARSSRSKGLLVVFLQLATSFKVFDVYVAGWPKGMECLTKMEADPPLAMFIRACELQERCGGSGLRDLLTMPLQRITQYRLLVESTLGDAPPHLAALHGELARSLTLPSTVTKEMNSAAVAIERRPYGERLNSPSQKQTAGTTMARLLGGGETSPKLPLLSRPKIKEGRLTKVCHDGPRSVRFVLFSDELFHSSLEPIPDANGRGEGGVARGPAWGGSTSARGHDHCQQQLGRHRGIGSIPLGRSFVIDDFEAPLHTSFIVVSAHVSFLLQANSVFEKNEWVAALKTSMERCVSSATSSVSSSRAGRKPLRRTGGNGRVTSADTIDSNTEASVKYASGDGGGCSSGGGGDDADDHRQSSTDGATTTSSAGSSASVSALTSPSASRSSLPSSASPFSCDDGLTPAAMAGGAAGGGDDGGCAVYAADADATALAAASDASAAGGAAVSVSGGGSTSSPSLRRRPSMHRPLLVGTATKPRDSHTTMQGGGGTNISERGGGEGRDETFSTRRRGHVVRLVSLRSTTNNGTASARLLTDGERIHPAGSSVGGGCGGGDSCQNSSSGGDDSGGGGCHKPRASPSSRCSRDGPHCHDGGDADDSRRKLEEISLWVACGPTGEVLRWTTLRLDAPLNDDAWNGVAGFRRALTNSACLAEFRELLRTRHASENLNFREAVAHYKALCYGNLKKPMLAPSSGTVSGAHTRANTPPMATGDDGAHKLSDGDDGAGKGKEQSSDSITSTSPFHACSSSCLNTNAAVAAARDIVNRFVKEGAPEQVNLSAMARESIILKQQQQQQQHQQHQQHQEEEREEATAVHKASASSPPPLPPCVNLFAKGWDEVSQLLQRDAFAQFRNTDTFLQLKNEWGGQPNGVLNASEFVVDSSDDEIPTGLNGSTVRASHSLAMIALRPPQRKTPPPPVETVPFPAGNRVEGQPAAEEQAGAPPVDTRIDAGKCKRIGTSYPFPSPENSLSPVAAVPALPPPPFPATIAALSAEEYESERAAASPPKTRGAGARREKIPAATGPRPRGMMVPGVKDFESIVSATAISKNGAESKSSGDDGGDNTDGQAAISSAANAAGELPSSNHGERDGGRASTNAKHCNFPPLPLASSIRNLSINTPLATPDISVGSQAATKTTTRTATATSAAKTTTATEGATKATTTKSDTPAMRGDGGVVESAKRFIWNLRAADETLATISPPITRQLTPSSPPAQEFSLSGTESLPAKAAADAAARVAESEGLVLRDGKEEGGVSGGEEEEDTELSSLSPPLAPPRLVDRRRSHAIAGAGAAAGVAKSQKTSAYSSSVREAALAPDGELAARATRGHVASAAAKKVTEQAGAAAMTPSKHSEPNHKSKVISTSERRRRDERGARKSPSHNKVHLLLKAAPGTGLGVMLAEKNGSAMVVGFRLMSDDSFDSVLGAGLRAGDVVLYVNGTAVRGNLKLASKLMMRGQANGELKLVVKRALETKAS